MPLLPWKHIAAGLSCKHWWSDECWARNKYGESAFVDGKQSKVQLPLRCAVVQSLVNI
jgi:hypothetical protein